MGKSTNPTNIYKHCMLCGGKLIDEIESLTCSKCGYKHYINPAPCNAVIIENEKGEILLVERKHNPKKGYWDLPGGFIQPYESFEESTKREVREELQVEIALGNIVGVYHDTYLFQGVNQPTLCVVSSAKITSGTLKPLDDVKSYKFFSPNDVLKQKIAFSGVITGLKDYFKNT